MPSLFDLEKVAEGVYAAVARPAALINCNAAIFENANDLLIVDSHSKPSAVISLVSQIRREIGMKPVRYIVNSHFHWDHSQGNSSYRRIAPHADIVASEPTRRLLGELGAARLKASVGDAEKSVARYKEQGAAAKTPEDKAFYQRMQVEARDYIAEMRKVTPELPNVTFDHDLIIRDKAHDLHLAFRGKAHTAGDIVVYCPQKKVVATGDMLHGFAPFMGDGYPRLWPRTLHHVAEFPFEHVIGGHGAVQHTRDRLYQMAGYIEELTEAVAVRKRAGKTLEQIQAEVTPASLKSLARGGYGDFIMDSARKFRPQEPGAAPALADAVKTNVAHAHAGLDRS
jgi:glyoxylase-like metal-dependent hydrolase (beta-lactamase superfamily II)